MTVSINSARRVEIRDYIAKRSSRREGTKDAKGKLISRRNSKETLWKKTRLLNYPSKFLCALCVLRGEKGFFRRAGFHRDTSGPPRGQRFSGARRAPLHYRSH